MFKLDTLVVRFEHASTRYICIPARHVPFRRIYVGGPKYVHHHCHSSSAQDSCFVTNLVHEQFSATTIRHKVLS